MLIALRNRVQHYERRVYSRLLRVCGGFGSIGSASFDPSVRIDNPQWMHIEDRVLVLRGGWLYCIASESGDDPPCLSIGAETYIGGYSHITAANKVRIGSGCVLANYVFIADSTHRYEDPAVPIMRQGLRMGEIEIGDRVLIGEHAAIFGRVKIGSGSVIGANAVVTNCDVPENSIIVGPRAEVLRVYAPSRTSAV